MAVLMASGVAVVPAAADPTCGSTPAPARSLAPVGVEHCDGLRPGAKIDSDWALGGTSPVERAASGCTTNFLFTDPAGHRYMGSAGHCFVHFGGERVYHSDRWTVTRNLKRIGYLVYAVYTGFDRDFALFRLDDDVRAEASVAHWGGPTGMYTGHSSGPVVLRHTGVGAGANATTPHRTSLAPHTRHRRHVVAQGVSVAGDSGGPAITTDGLAVALITDAGAASPDPTDAVNLWLGPRIDVSIAAAEAALGFPLKLVTAKLR